ncbi:hypothetical protein [Pyxidicoccus xibeiensis]|uniref:hypothetical protein n=1 Tax=Pyxidicoccus xibeiensis TaxID=2906759 RepID=UPI0020A7FB43|nr:hypothetical protein [Pyxidicoccus xibeiensis]MCP3143446.1 hypothetical protein [Pyxidicoccus xibeiensis]
MNRKALAVLSGLLALSAPVACSSQAKSASTPSGQPETPSAARSDMTKTHRPDTAKPSAPVDVKAELDKDRARVTLRFDAPATDVQVNISGVDGLTVKSAPTPVDGASFVAAGESSFDVTFTPGAGRSHLVVAVTGNFRGAHQSKVASFAVGTPSKEQQKSTGTTVTGEDGQRIKVMPSGGGQ